MVSCRGILQKQSLRISPTSQLTNLIFFATGTKKWSALGSSNEIHSLKWIFVLPSHIITFRDLTLSSSHFLSCGQMSYWLHIFENWVRCDFRQMCFFFPLFHSVFAPHNVFLNPSFKIYFCKQIKHFLFFSTTCILTYKLLRWMHLWHFVQFFLI